MKLTKVLQHLVYQIRINRYEALTQYHVQNLTDIVSRLRNEYGIRVALRKHKDPKDNFWFIPYDAKEGAWAVLQILGGAK
jgi:GTP cyclohydrolase III